MKCTNCGAPIESDFNMCPYCGMSMKEMIDAEDVYEKIDDMDDKLENIQSRLSTPSKGTSGNPSYTPHPPSKAEETMGKLATSIFFVVFFIVLIIILGNALTMCATMPRF